MWDAIEPGSLVDSPPPFNPATVSGRMCLMSDTQPAIDATAPAETADIRLERALAWAAEQLDQAPNEFSPVSGDASFRRYFRLHTPNGPLILMVAPPEHGGSEPFVNIASRLRKAGLHAPKILHFDLEQGYGLLEDLGDQLYRDLLTPTNADELLPGLFDVLTRMAAHTDATGLPPYDHALLQTELDLFPDWYLGRHKQVVLSGHEAQIWQAVCEQLKQSATGQAQAFVHRDFHSCNLLYREGEQVGIIDFQDAVQGPLNYDFISLVWDRYIAWPRARLETWMESFRSQLAPGIPAELWVKQCDWMGLQRNLKIVGIFARLHYRDSKTGYLEMVPRFYQYLLDVLPLYPEFKPFLDILEQPECAP